MKKLFLFSLLIVATTLFAEDAVLVENLSKVGNVATSNYTWEGDVCTWDVFQTARRVQDTISTANQKQAIWMSVSQNGAAKITSTNLEGGIKAVAFKFARFGSEKTAGRVLQLEVTAGEMKDSTLTYANNTMKQGTNKENSAHETYSFAFNNKQGDAQLSIENISTYTETLSTSGICRICVGDITITPYLVYTTKEVVWDLREGATTYTNTGLINNTDEGAVVYTISENTIGATIDAATGAVTATKAGQVTVTATWEGISTSYTLTILAKDVATAAFEKEYVLVKINETAPANVLTTNSTATPVYESSNVEVATVDATGAVTLVGVGQTVITATLAENADYTAASASYTLRVVPTTFKLETFDGAINATGDDTYLRTPTASWEASAATGLKWTTYLGSVKSGLVEASTDNIAAVIRGRKPAEVEAEWENAYLVSDTIKGGIASLAFDWNCNGNESSRENPWDIEVYVNDTKVGAITDQCTDVQPMGSWYRFTVENINVAGDFTIKVVNKNDADADKNHYRFVLDNLEWWGYEAPVVITLHKVLAGEDLQAAVNGAVSGDTVLVQAGTYEGNFTMKDGVFVSGGWNADFTAQTKHASILDAKANGRVLNQPANFETLTIWENFTIQNGKLTEIQTDKLGSGVALMKKGRVINCLIQNNTFDYSGNCMGGGLGQETGDKNDTCAINCVVRNNKATHGGGVRIRGVILNSTIEYNESSNNGGGLYLQAGSAYNCIITNNVSLSGGGGVDMYGTGSLVNCLVANNTAGNVGGLSMRSNNRETEDSGSDIINCTIVNNTQKNTNNPQFCGVRLDVRSNPNRAFVNNVVYGNTINGEVQAQELGGYPQGYGKFLNNAVAGTTANVTYIQLDAENDPQFNEDYSFATTSPLYNAGTNDALAYFVGDKDVYGNARKQGENIEIGAVEIAEPTQTIITETFDLTTEDTRNMMGSYNVYAGDYILRIFGYEGAGTYQDDPATEEVVEVQLFTPDYEEPINAVVIVTIDEENNKEVMQVTATSADGKKIYNLTFNIVAPEIQEHVLNITYPTIKVEESPLGGSMYIIEGEAMMDTEDNIVSIWMNVLPASNYAEMGIGEDIYASGEALVSEPFMGEFTIEATLTDEAGNIYYVSVLAQEIKQDVEIVVADTVALDGYKLAFEDMAGVSLVTADVNGIEFFFWLTKYTEENGYGTYFNESIQNVWYGEMSLTPYGDEHVYSAEHFKVSFINDPDEEGNVTLYNFTLIPGDKPANPTGLDNINATVAPVKMIENGRLVIICNGAAFNSIGQKL